MLLPYLQNEKLGVSLGYPSPSLMEQKPSSAVKFLLAIAVIVLLVFVLVLDTRRREVEQRLKQVSFRLEQVQNPGQNKELAKQVLTKLRKHILLPTDPEPTVATIIDVEKLRKTNDFYKKAENGYHLILTKDRAVLYDAKRDLVIDVIPVQLQPPQQAGAAGQGAKEP